MLSNARKFLTSYHSDPTKINLGANIYILERLLKKDFISIDDDSLDEDIFSSDSEEESEDREFDFNSFINEYSEILKTTDLRTYIVNDEFLYLEYLNAIDIHHKIIINQEIFMSDENKDSFKDIFKNDKGTRFFYQNYTRFSSARVLNFDLKLNSGREDLEEKQRKFQFQSRLEETRALDHVPEDAEWPYSKIFDLPIFAFEGFSEKRIKDKYDNHFDATGFFSEIAKNDIQYIVALGIAGDEAQRPYDFPAYFIVQQEYIKTDKDKNVIRKVTVTPQQTKQVSDEFILHKLQCDLETFDEQKNTFIKKSFSTCVINIPVYDCHPIILKDDSYFKLLSYLVIESKKGKKLAVHCKATRGRTGEFIGEFLNILLSRFPDIFKTDDEKEILSNIKKFVEELRTQRAGLMLEWIQVYQYLINCFQFYISVLKAQKEISLAKQAQSAETSDAEPAQKKQKIENQASNNQASIAKVNIFLPQPSEQNEQREGAREALIPPTNTSTQSPKMF